MQARLLRANLHGVVAERADFTEANLREVNLGAALLRHPREPERHEYTGTLAVLIELVLKGPQRLAALHIPPVVPAPQSGDESSIR